MRLAWTWQGAIQLPDLFGKNTLYTKVSEISKCDKFLNANSCHGGHIEISHMM